jgi:diguanylate cyclase (GGDEF)-like protein
VEKKYFTQISQPEPLDLSQWRKFQEGLSSLLDIPVALCNDKGFVIAPPSRKNDMCDAIKGAVEQVGLCGDLNSYLRDISRDQVHVFKCPSDHFIFSVPVPLEKDLTFFIFGQLHLTGEARRFCEAMAGLGFNEGTFERLKDELKVLPSEAVFGPPGIIKKMAVPFIKCLYSCGYGEAVVPYEGAAEARLKAFQVLQDVCSSIATVRDRKELYDIIVKKSTELVGAEKGSLMILDDSVLSVKAALGIDRTFAESLKVKLGESISGSIAKKGEPVVVRDIERAIPSRKNRPRYRTKSFISIPLKVGSNVIGVINISDKITGEVFSDEDLNMVLSFANYASIALERETYYTMSEELKTISMTDPLTGIFNRRYFLQRLLEEVERVKRHNNCFAILIVDIDDFKAFNDKYGHLAGDEILKETSGAITDGVRAIDVVARLGGEEFGVILPNTRKQDSFIIAERIRKAVERMRLPQEKFPVKEGTTVSIGMAEFPYDAENIEELIHNADKAMYRAKSLGKNKVVCYER